MSLRYETTNPNHLVWVQMMQLIFEKLIILISNYARSYRVACGGKCHLWGTRCHLFGIPENFLAFFIVVFCCFIFVAKERSPNIFVEINLGLCNIQEN